jgi:hypothetical protein
MIDLGHVKTLRNSRTKVGISTTSKEFVQLDQETSVGVCGLDNLGGGLVSGTTTTCFQINSHVEVFQICNQKGPVVQDNEKE